MYCKKARLNIQLGFFVKLPLIWTIIDQILVSLMYLDWVLK